MATERKYGQTPEDVTHSPAEAEMPVYQSGEGDPVNRAGSEARWGPENVGGVWLFAMALGALFISVLILFLVIGLFV
jgi:hypothetical protein